MMMRMPIADNCFDVNFTDITLFVDTKSFSYIFRILDPIQLSIQLIDVLLLNIVFFPLR